MNNTGAPLEQRKFCAQVFFISVTEILFPWLIDLSRSNLHNSDIKSFSSPSQSTLLLVLSKVFDSPKCTQFQSYSWVKSNGIAHSGRVCLPSLGKPIGSVLRRGWREASHVVVLKIIYFWCFWNEVCLSPHVAQAGLDILSSASWAGITGLYILSHLAQSL